MGIHYPMFRYALLVCIFSGFVAVAMDLDHIKVEWARSTHIAVAVTIGAIFLISCIFESLGRRLL